VREDGTALSVVHLAPGDKVMGCALDGGRHFGMAVSETICEK
jgi:3-dehydroquinate synthase II